jgi:outer membrane protein assembly factor BamB
VDEAARSVEQVWSYRADPDLYSFSLGDVHRIENGNTLVTFSNQGQIDEVNADGELIWQLNLSVGGALGYLTYLDALPQPD